MLQTIDERALANLSRLHVHVHVDVQVWSGVSSLMIGPATRATIGVKLAFLEADSLLQLEAIRDLLLLGGVARVALCAFISANKR